MREGRADKLTVTDEIQRRVVAWKQSEKAVSDAEYALSRAQSVRDQARLDVFKWLVPEGAKIGEKFSVWCGDSLYTCERVNGSEFSITESQRAQKA